MHKKSCAYIALLITLVLLMSACSELRGRNLVEEWDYIPNVKDEMLSASYWTSKIKEKDKTIMSEADIARFNKQCAASELSGVCDLATHASTVTSAQIKSYLSEFAMPDTELLDRDGVPYSQEYLDFIITSVNNENIIEQNKVSFALVLCNTNLRTFPTKSSAFISTDTLDDDIFQQSALNIGEPVVILHLNLEQDWYFVQTADCRGWVSKKDVVFMEKGSWVSYVNSRDFVMVTGAAVTLDANPFDASATVHTLRMGTKLPLYTEGADNVSGQGTAASVVVRIPSQDKYGNLEFVPVAIPRSSDISVGYLEYTAENVISQAFKLLGRRNIKNGMYGGIDNASFVTEVFAVFGFTLPRTLSEQQSVPMKETDVSEMTPSERLAAFGKLAPGTLFYTSDACYLFLGMENGIPFTIFPAQTFYYNSKPYIANTVLVTGLTNVVRRDGITLGDAVIKCCSPALIEKTESGE